MRSNNSNSIKVLVGVTLALVALALVFIPQSRIFANPNHHPDSDSKVAADGAGMMMDSYADTIGGDLMSLIHTAHGSNMGGMGGMMGMMMQMMGGGMMGGEGNGMGAMMGMMGGSGGSSPGHSGDDADGDSDSPRMMGGGGMMGDSGMADGEGMGSGGMMQMMSRMMGEGGMNCFANLDSLSDKDPKLAAKIRNHLQEAQKLIAELQALAEEEPDASSSAYKL